MGDTRSNFFAFNPDGTTQRVWSLPTSIYSSAAIAEDGTIYVGCNSGGLYALNPDGTTNDVWQLDTYGYRIQGSPAIGLDGTVYIGQYDGSLFFALQGAGGKLADAPWPKWGQNMQNTCRDLLPPTNVTATTITPPTKALVSWNTEPGATGYQVWKGVSLNPLAATLLRTTNGLAFTDTSVVPVLTNYYWVRSTNSVFVSDFSAFASVTRAILPVTNVIASQGTYSNKVIVSWNISPDAGKYYVYANTNNTPASAILIGQTNGTSFLDSMVPAGVPSYYWVRVSALSALSSLSPSATGWRGIIDVSASDGLHLDKVAVSWPAVPLASGYGVWRNTATTISSATLLTSTTAMNFDDTTPLAGTFYYYWIQATNAFGMNVYSMYNRGWRATGAAPGIPSGVTASDGNYADKVAIAWEDVSEASQFVLYRHTVNNSGAAPILTLITGTTYDDTSAVIGTTYYYWVKATNAYGISGFSSSASGYRAEGVVPAAPNDITASDGTDSEKVTVTWSAADTATGYEIWRNISTDSGSASMLAATAATSNNDTSASPGVLYYYWVKATNAYGNSGFGVGDWGYRQPGAAPETPAGVTATDGDYVNAVGVTWTASSGVSTYSIWRSTTNDTGSAALLTENLIATDYADETALPGRTYYYWVSAANAYGGSAWSTPNSGWARSALASALSVNNYNGDGRADLAIFDNNSGNWYIMTATGEVVLWADPWGWPGAIPVPGDYDGDGLFDQAVFDNNTGNWYIKSLAGTIIAWAQPWGWPGADPVYGDYDGDGKSDLGVFDTITGNWYVYSLSQSTLVWAEPWGWPNADTVPGDYDGDGKSDLTVFDNNTGGWYSLSAQGAVIHWAQLWGWPGAVTVPGDYDGDGADDLAVFDNNTGNWYIYSAVDTVLVWARPWGWPGAIPVPGDYDGDGKSDLAVFDNNTGNWYIITTDDVVLVWAVPWGWPGATVVGGR